MKTVDEVRAELHQADIDLMTASNAERIIYERLKPELDALNRARQTSKRAMSRFEYLQRELREVIERGLPQML